MKKIIAWIGAVLFGLYVLVLAGFVVEKDLKLKNIKDKCLGNRYKNRDKETENSLYSNKIKFHSSRRYIEKIITEWGYVEDMKGSEMMENIYDDCGLIVSALPKYNGGHKWYIKDYDCEIELSDYCILKMCEAILDYLKKRK
jgi:hypothetical protein